MLSEDAVRRGFAKIDETAGLTWLQNHLDYCSAPLFGEPWVPDTDTTIKPLYGHQEGAEVGYIRTNPVGHRTATTRSCCRVSVWC